MIRQRNSPSLITEMSWTSYNIVSAPFYFMCVYNIYIYTLYNTSCVYIYSHSSFCSRFVSLLIRFAHRSLRPSFFLFSSVQGTLLLHTHTHTSDPSLFVCFFCLLLSPFCRLLFISKRGRARIRKKMSVMSCVSNLFFYKSQMFFAVGEQSNIYVTFDEMNRPSHSIPTRIEKYRLSL